MKRDVKCALEQALEEEALCVEDLKAELLVGNRRGLNLGLPARVRVLEQQVTEIPSHKIEIASLEDGVGSLTPSLDAYKQATEESVLRLARPSERFRRPLLLDEFMEWK